MFGVHRLYKGKYGCACLAQSPGVGGSGSTKLKRRMSIPRISKIELVESMSIFSKILIFSPSLLWLVNMLTLSIRLRVIVHPYHLQVNQNAVCQIQAKT